MAAPIAGAAARNGVFEEQQQDQRAGRHRQVARRPRQRDQNVVALDVLEVAQWSRGTASPSQSAMPPYTIEMIGNDHRAPGGPGASADSASPGPACRPSGRPAAWPHRRARSHARQTPSPAPAPETRSKPLPDSSHPVYRSWAAAAISSLALPLPLFPTQTISVQFLLYASARPQPPLFLGGITVLQALGPPGPAHSGLVPSPRRHPCSSPCPSARPLALQMQPAGACNTFHRV